MALGLKTGFNSLFEMRILLGMWTDISTILACVSILYLRCRPIGTPKTPPAITATVSILYIEMLASCRRRWRGGVLHRFNSLFEMRRRWTWRCTAGMRFVSILYVEMPKGPSRNTTLLGKSVVSILYLRCQQPPPSQSPRSRAVRFNSLFEMHSPT